MGGGMIVVIVLVHHKFYHMFYHVKDLQCNARVSKPDPRFANILLEQFGGENGELTSAKTV